MVKLDSPMDEGELQAIQFFRCRLAELESNWLELEKEGFDVTGWLGRDFHGKLSTSGAGVTTHRLKGLYIDFRYFWAEREPSNFFKIQNLIAKHSTKSNAVKGALTANKKLWRKANAGNRWHGLSPNEMINAIFYGTIIHQAEDMQGKLTHVKEVLSEPAMHHILASTIWARTGTLRSLKWILDPLEKGSQFVQVPDCFS